jgi:hypothetical protein
MRPTQYRALAEGIFEAQLLDNKRDAEETNHPDDLSTGGAVHDPTTSRELLVAHSPDLFIRISARRPFSLAYPELR